MSNRSDLQQYGWRMGRSHEPRGVDLWVPYDRTCGVFGVQGSGKTLDLLTPALLPHPGAALVTLTKPEDLYLTLRARQAPAESGGPPRPIAVLDPYGLAPGLPELVFDPIAGCADPEVAERRAAAFAAGTVQAASEGQGDTAARFYATEATKVLQGFFHAAALTDRNLEHVLGWVAQPRAAREPENILASHPHAAPYWDGLLRDALNGGNAETASNTATTVQQAMKLFFQPKYRARCVPGPGRPATDVNAVIAAGGTLYLLGRDDRMLSAAPLMTAVAEFVLDAAKDLGMASPHGRLCPPLLAVLDELPSIAPIPTLKQRMANERALGVSFIYASQTLRQMVIQYGEDEAWALFGLTNVIAVFGRGKDMKLYEELSRLIGDIRVERITRSSGGRGGSSRSRSSEDVPVLKPAAMRQIPAKRALIVADEAPPIIAALSRCVDGPAGQALLKQQQAVRATVEQARPATADIARTTEEAITWSRINGLSPTHDRASGDYGDESRTW
ncbi:MAG: TraM recognition domain-containing protein [Jatrophihabitantaceae bacterium]